jgi:hypothetical protein
MYDSLLMLTNKSIIFDFLKTNLSIIDKKKKTSFYTIYIESIRLILVSNDVIH